MNEAKAAMIHDVWRETSTLADFIEKCNTTPFILNIGDDVLIPMWYAFEAFTVDIPLE
jgi:hypothetical protein